MSATGCLRKMGDTLMTDTQTAFVLVPREPTGAGIVWPEPRVIDPDIAAPTGVPYLDCLLHRLLDAQQDINLAANEGMSQPLADAAALIDEVEAAIRKMAAPKPPESEIGPVAWGINSGAGFYPFTAIQRFAEIWAEQGFTVQPLYPQARIDADAAIIAALRAEVARLQECAVTWEHNWKSERDVKLQCVLHARAAERRAEAAEAREKELERRLRDETAIVDRIWDMFGRPSYEELAGRSIYDLIAELQARVALASKKETVDERPA